MRAITITEVELNHLHEQITCGDAEREALRGEFRVVRTERDLLKEPLSVFIRRLFAAKSEARGTEQKDWFFNEAEQLAPVVPAEEVPAKDKVNVPAHSRAKREEAP